MQSEIWFDDITDAEVLRSDLLLEAEDANAAYNSFYAGPFDLDWHKYDVHNDNPANPRASLSQRNYYAKRLSLLGRPDEIPDGK